ncbi:serine protease easter-like [Anoplophora glabripennis]|uniref:serine protease easter-like n=1 Tax=Anoplophora glabripennis TaxID=217634 RepID=UPI000874348C|nr:serine protease easter-like [Anoplophora glabripennis]
MTGIKTYILSVLYIFVCGNRSLQWPLPEQCGKTRFDLRNEFRIIEGEEACLGEFPWAARLGVFMGKDRISFVCAGSLISKYYVISAAHCMRSNMVRLGENYLDTDPDCNDTCAPKPQDIKIENYIKHDLYSSTSHTYDYALLELEKPVEFNDFVHPICLPPAPIPHEDLKSEHVYIAGWGIINRTEFTQYATRLMYITAPILDAKPCNELYHRELIDSQLCIGYQKGKDSCAGDSGGPVFKAMTKNKQDRAHLIGVVSYGLRACGQGPAVYTDVSYFVQWTLERIKKK